MHRSANTRKNLNLKNINVDIEDVSYRSEYFIVSDLESTFTSGKNYFSINGSNKLKRNTAISLEVLDSTNEPLYYEIGKIGYNTYKETTDIVVSVHVFETVPSGFGSITLVGTTVDGRSVRWTTSIKIDPTIDNSSRVIFFEPPKAERSEFLSFVLNEGWTATAQQLRTISGSIYGYAHTPSVFTDIDSVDYRKQSIDYRVSYSSPTNPELTLFTKDNEQSEVTLYVSSLSVLDNGLIKPLDVNITRSFKLSSVLNSTTLKLSEPFTYTINGKEIIVPISSGSFVQTYYSTTYITSSGLIPGVNPDGEPDPNVFLQKPVGNTYAFLKEPFLDITYRNLKTLTGKIHRHKVYRRSLNKASDFECISDEPLLETEVLFDKSTANRAFAKIGDFYNINHIIRYYYSSSADLSIQHSSEDILDSMVITANNANLNGDNYIIVKNDTSLLTISSSKSTYVNFNEDQDLIKTGSAYDSNFITLYKGSDYLFSANVDLYKLDSTKEAKLMFFFTGSYNTGSSVSEPFFYQSGLKLHEYVIPEGRDSLSVSGPHFGKIIKFSNDYKGTIKIVPVNLRRARLSNVSFKTFAEFGFSPDVFSTRIYFPVTIKNEQFELRSEFFDVNSKSVYNGLRSIVNIDKEGETLFKNITNYLITDSETIRSVVSSGSLTISSSRVANGLGYDSSTNRAALSVVESFVVQSGSAHDRFPFFIAEFGPGDTGPTVRVSGSLKLTGSLFVLGGDERLYATSSWAISSSYSYKASSSLSSSGADTAYSSSVAISSSYSYKASSSLSSSGANSAYSSSAAISSSHAFKTDSSLSSSHLIYDEDVAPVGSPTVAGYITATLAGNRIYIPYYTSV